MANVHVLIRFAEYCRRGIMILIGQYLTMEPQVKGPSGRVERKGYGRAPDYPSKRRDRSSGLGHLCSTSNPLVDQATSLSAATSPLSRAATPWSISSGVTIKGGSNYQAVGPRHHVGPGNSFGGG